MSVLQKIADIEAEMAKTQKNKATSAHLGLLKAKLAKLRRELIDPKNGSGGGGKGEGFDVQRTGQYFITKERFFFNATYLQVMRELVLSVSRQ
jgi:ribosome-interacting GTPase 1